MRYVLLLVMLLAACVPMVDSCRIGATTIMPNGNVITHLSAEAIKDPELAKFVNKHEEYHALTRDGNEFKADEYAEELSYLGVSPCPAARHLKRCGLKDRASALGLRNSCEGF